MVVSRVASRCIGLNSLIIVYSCDHCPLSQMLYGAFYVISVKWLWRAQQSLSTEDPRTIEMLPLVVDLPPTLSCHIA